MLSVGSSLNMKTFLFLALFAAASVRASVVDVVNGSDASLRFTAASVQGDSVDALVAPRSSRRWSVPDDANGASPVVYSVDLVSTSGTVNAGALTVNPEKCYVVTYDVVAGLVGSERTHDAGTFAADAPSTAARVASWVRFGMFFQFGVEVCGLCLMVLNISRKQWVSWISTGGNE